MPITGENAASHPTGRTFPIGRDATGQPPEDGANPNMSDTRVPDDEQAETAPGDVVTIEITEPDQWHRRPNRRERRKAGARRSHLRGQARRNLGKLIDEGQRLAAGERLTDDEAHR
jgi:hypothetical protein